MTLSNDTIAEILRRVV